MGSRIHVKTTFEPRRTIQPIYTGGSVALDRAGQLLVTCLGEEAVLTELNTGRCLARIEGVCEISSVRCR
jgi:U3 small nucleolar RNA-associated protein 13